MSLDLNSSSVITLNEAKTFIQDFKTLNPLAVKAVFAGSNKLNMILDQQGCIGIRMYFGYDNEEKRNNLVLVGVDSDEKDMTSGVILERLEPCPSKCDKTSSLYI